MTTKIAFYSPCEKCGTTTHMFLFAWMFARNNKKQSVVVEQGEQYRILRKGTTQERIVLSDCGSGKTRRARHHLQTADILVVTLPYEPAELSTYFLYRKPEVRPVFFLIGNCRERREDVTLFMEHRYRILEEDIGCILYNNEISLAIKHRRLLQFLAAYETVGVTELNRNFFEEVERSFFLFWKKIETMIKR